MASHWLPEDDFRLRKSIENGASLESLAKGAVKFSRKFTLEELTDRWRSLLYSPQVTSLSSSVAFDLEYSDQLLPQTRHHRHTTPVRSQYYTARKRMRVEEEPLHAEISPVEFGEFVFDGSDELFDFNDSDLEIFHNSFPGIMHQKDYDADDDMLVDQLLNINDGQIYQGCDATDTTIPTMDQEELQDPLFQQPNASLIETLASVSRHQVTPAQTETWDAPDSHQDLPIKPELCRQNATSLSEWDPHPEIKDGVINCLLSQKCSEIPDNDHINLQRPKARNSINPSSSRRHMNPHLPPIRGSTSSSQAKGNNVMSHSYGFGGCAATAHASSCSSAFKDGFAEKATSSFTATTSTSQHHFPVTEIEQFLSAEMDINASMSEAEENHNEIESDEDLPSFSDVEAMVLDMDLESIGQDQNYLEASRYRNEEIVRRIIRLEQSSKSYMNRDIASHGAFAILYGSSKHYINKPEVLLGRATGEYPVDIDLARSGTKVSRRQALIMLKQDGCFQIKNLGKFSIWISEKEVGHGEVVNLKNNSLIQIRDMSFVFETNEREVRRYLDGIHR